MVVNLLVALAVSLVVNFSYLLLVLVDESSDPPHKGEEKEFIECTGWLDKNPDGHGYLLVATAEGVDSLYLPQNRINWLQLQDGDFLKVRAEVVKLGHPRVKAVLERNGERFDEATLYHRPSKGVAIGAQLLFYLLHSFLVILLMTSGGEKRGYTSLYYLKRLGICILLSVLLYLIAPVQRWRTGELVLQFQQHQWMDYVLLLRILFTLVVSALYGYIYGLLHKSQRIAIENEHLKNENLTSRYNMLASQVNPHFFFNSLNSLAMLVREGKTDGALTYIDRLSYTFRYILQSGKATLVTLDEELSFAEAYSYLFHTRYADKLFFDVEVDEEAKGYLLPALTLQPLMGNAVKHNTITRQQPLRVKIRTEGDCLVVENPHRPKLDPEPGMGIGLENLQNRWELIMGRSIQVEKTDDYFRVRMPLKKK